jgi:hypothetical protein
VRNAYATYPVQGDSPWKHGLIPHNIILLHGRIIKVQAVQDGHAYDKLDGKVTAYHGYDH